MIKELLKKNQEGKDKKKQIENIVVFIISPTNFITFNFSLK